VFDKIIILIAKNENKIVDTSCEFSDEFNNMMNTTPCNVVLDSLDSGVFLSDYCYTHKVDAVIRGLRNGNDLQYEQNMLYWNEDLGLEVPTVFFICDRKLGHISSSAIRGLNGIK